MDFEKILKNAFEIKEIKPNTFQVKTGAILPNGKPLYCFIEKLQNGYVLSDKKYILNYMNGMYLISSGDVKQCISNVVSVNHFKIAQGNIVKEFSDEKEFVQIIFSFIICAFQLINMYVFFDPPDKRK